MIPVVVANNQVVNLRHILRFINIRAFKRLVDKDTGEAIQKTGSTSTRFPDNWSR